MKNRFSRRQFVRTGVAAGTFAATGALCDSDSGSLRVSSAGGALCIKAALHTESHEFPGGIFQIRGGLFLRSAGPCGAGKSPHP